MPRNARGEGAGLVLYQDLGESRSIDGVSYIHHGTKSIGTWITFGRGWTVRELGDVSGVSCPFGPFRGGMGFPDMAMHEGKFLSTGLRTLLVTKSDLLRICQEPRE